MNKLFIVVLAVCLISVNSAIVKRDAEATTPSYLQNAQNELQKLTENVKNELAKAFNPDEIKKQINTGLDEFSKLLNQQGAKQ